MIVMNPMFGYFHHYLNTSRKGLKSSCFCTLAFRMYLVALLKMFAVFQQNWGRSRSVTQVLQHKQEHGVHASRGSGGTTWRLALNPRQFILDA
jgi:hypothetical protein